MRLHTHHKPVSWPAGWTREATHSPQARLLASRLDRRGYTLIIGQSVGQLVEDEATHLPLASMLASWLDRHTHHRPVSWPGGRTDRQGYTLTTGQPLGQVVGQTYEATHSP